MGEIVKASRRREARRARFAALSARTGRSRRARESRVARAIARRSESINPRPVARRIRRTRISAVRAAGHGRLLRGARRRAVGRAAGRAGRAVGRALTGRAAAAVSAVGGATYLAVTSAQGIRALRRRRLQTGPGGAKGWWVTVRGRKVFIRQRAARRRR